MAVEVAIAPPGRVTVKVTEAPDTGPLDFETVAASVTFERAATLPGDTVSDTEIGSGGAVTVTFAVAAPE